MKKIAAALALATCAVLPQAANAYLINWTASGLWDIGGDGSVLLREDVGFSFITSRLEDRDPGPGVYAEGFAQYPQGGSYVFWQDLNTIGSNPQLGYTFQLTTTYMRLTASDGGRGYGASLTVSNPNGILGGTDDQDIFSRPIDLLAPGTKVVATIDDWKVFTIDSFEHRINWVVVASDDPTKIPEPSPVALIGAGLAGLIWVRRRKDTRQQA